MQLGVDGVFVGSGIFKSADPKKRAAAMVQAVTHYNDPAVLARVSEDLGDAMVSIFHRIRIMLICCEQVGINCDDLAQRWAIRESTHKEKPSN